MNSESDDSGPDNNRDWILVSVGHWMLASGVCIGFQSFEFEILIPCDLFFFDVKLKRNL
jgi:hypothetical protein